MKNTLVLLSVLGTTLVGGCISGGDVALPEGEPSRISGHLLAAHEEEPPEEGEEHEHGEGDPLPDIPLRLVVGTSGIAVRLTTGDDGHFDVEVPAGLYHVGVILPAGALGSTAAETQFLIRAEVTAEPLGVLATLLAEEDEGAYHLDLLLFDDENGNGELDESEAELLDLVVDVPYGTTSDLIVNPEEEAGGTVPDPHGHSHG